MIGGALFFGECPVGIRAISLRTGDPASVHFQEEQTDQGVWILHGRPREEESEALLLEWKIRLTGVAGKWDNSVGSDRSLTANWTGWLEAYATRNAPVICLFGMDGRNCLTFAVSEALNPVRMQAQVDEDSATILCRIVLGDHPCARRGDSFSIRLDLRGVGYHVALAGMAAWWEGMPAYRPAQVPQAACDPVYSTWYSYHQELNGEEIEAECLLAKELGFGTVIVDDGWQCGNHNKGYDFCGDWEMNEAKFPDFPSHVRRVQGMGLKYLLWFSAPYAGTESRALETFRDRVLPKPFRNAFCLDPRYPEVRQYLWECWDRAVAEWGVDGLKLDFVDQFTAEAEGRSVVEQADFTSVPEAADCLLAGAMERLRKVRPDVLVEFRQKYTGPAMRKYGNMFRANDCPGDALSNRVRTLDVRLLAGASPVHSDMVMWSREESSRGVALQLWATLFSVPQVSVRLAGLTGGQRRVLAFYLAFWKRHRELLLGGALEPVSPQELFPMVRVQDGGTELVAVYSSRIVDGFCGQTQELLVINATDRDRLVLDLPRLPVEAMCWDCCGDEVEIGLPHLGGVEAVSVPSGGVARFLF